MAELNKISSFKSFTEVKAQQNVLKLREENQLKRQELATNFAKILDEMGLTSISELDEDTQKTFITKLFGEGNAFGAAVKKAKEDGEEEFELDGKTVKVEESRVNEAIKVEGKRDAKKVVTVYNKIFNKVLVDLGAMANDSILGCIKYLMQEAMVDANFHREAAPVSKMIKGNIKPLEIKMPGLGGHFIKIGPTTIKSILDKYYSDIANAAGWSGMGIAEGTALYLEQIKQEAIGQAVINKFNSTFEGEDVRIDIESKLNETKSVVTEGAVKQFEMDLEDMIKDIKRGYGWIDPEYVAQTWDMSSDTIDFEIVKAEVYRRLIKAGILAYPNDDNEDVAGKNVKSLKELGIKESITNEAFSRMSNDAIGNELYAASQALTTYYDWLKAGNDAGKGKSIDHIISLLKKCKSSIKRFDDKEETIGTEYESPAMESVVTESEAQNILDDLLDERGGDMGELHGMEMEDALDTVEAYGHKGSKAKKIAQELHSLCNESTVTEAKFVKDNRDVLDAKTKEEVLELYPNAEFFIGKSDHFFGELDGNLFFKAYYTKAQKEFEIKSVYSQKGSNYVHLYNESVVNESEAENILNDLLDERGGDMGELHGMSMEDALDTVGSYGHKGSKAKKIAKELVSMTNESVVTEAEVKSDEEFQEYAFTVLKKAFGEEFDEEKAQEVVDGILSKSNGDYGTAVGTLTSSLG